MAWTTPGTAVAGEVLTAAFWNEQVRDNSNFLFDNMAIRQIVRGTPLTEVRTTTSATIADVTGLNVSITPQLASSKILVIATMVAETSGNTARTDGRVAITNSSNTNLAGAQEVQVGSATATGAFYAPLCLIGFDNPGVTSSVTYKTRFRLFNAAGTNALSIRAADVHAVMYALEVLL